MLHDSIFEVEFLLRQLQNFFAWWMKWWNLDRFFMSEYVGHVYDEVWMDLNRLNRFYMWTGWTNFFMKFMYEIWIDFICNLNRLNRFFYEVYVWNLNRFMKFMNFGQYFFWTVFFLVNKLMYWIGWRVNCKY